MIKNTRLIAPVLCIALLLSSQSTRCGWLLGLPLSLLSITCHTVGGAASVVAGVFGSRAVLSGLVKESETKQIVKFGEGILSGIAKLCGEKDEAAVCANWFSSGNPEDDGAVAFVLVAASVTLHGTGFLAAFIAGRSTAKSQKMIHYVRQEAKRRSDR